MAFGENLTFLRKSRGLSQEQLAEELDLTRQTISKWELNQSSPDLDFLLQLSDFFQVSTDDLIKKDLIKGGEPNCASDESAPDSHRAASTPTQNNFFLPWYSYCVIVTVALSLIGILAFAIASAVHPWTTFIHGHHYTGLLGFLLGSHTFWLFIVLSVLFLLGIGVTAYEIMKAKHRQAGK